MLAMLGVALLASLTASIVLTPFVRAVARRYGLVVRPRDDRWHTVPTALYGGVAIAAAVCFGTAVAFALLEAPSDRSAVIAILTATLALFFVGIVDDAHGMSPVAKLIAQFAGAAFLVWSGLIIALTPWMSINVLVTLFWFVGVSNALNLLDNMDGAAAGVAAVAAVGFAALFLVEGDIVTGGFALVVAGAAAGFLLHNFKPATIFMGDSGSLLLGSALAGLGASYSSTNPFGGTVVLLVPMIIVLVPVVDTTLVTFARVLNGRPISVGGRDHMTHRLVAMGLSEVRAVLFLYACGFAASVIAFLIAQSRPALGVWVGSVTLMISLVFAAYLGKLHQYDDLGTRPKLHSLVLRNVLVKRRGFVLLLDIALFGAAYYGAYLLYYELEVPERIATTAVATLGIVIVIKMLAFNHFGVYRAKWSLSTVADIHRVVKASVLATLLMVTASFLASRGGVVPRTVFVLDMLLTGVLALSARMSFRSFDRFRMQLKARTSVPTLIFVPLHEAELVLAAIAIRPDLDMRPVGFVIDGAVRVGEYIDAVPVIDRGKLSSTVMDGDVQVVICGTNILTDDVRQLLSGLSVRVLQFRAEFYPTVLVDSRAEGRAATGGIR